MKTVSVVVPAYNCEKTINKCIDSLVNQTYKHTEIIVINDGSVDNTLNILNTYEEKLSVYTIENKGVANARNFGLKKATGDFLMFVDSDDYLDLDCIQKLIDKQEKSDADIVRFSYKIVYTDGRMEKPIDYFSEERIVLKENFKENIYKYFISGIRFNSIWACLYKRDIVKNILFKTNMRTAEDAVFSLSAYTNAKRVMLVTDVFYYYYQTGFGLTGSGLKLFDKYKCNYMFAFETLKFLKKWNMNRFIYGFCVLIRPIKLTFSKIRRMK